MYMYPNGVPSYGGLMKTCESNCDYIPAWFDSVECDGTEEYIQQCEVKTWGAECPLDKAIGVVCYSDLYADPNGNNGR